MNCSSRLRHRGRRNWMMIPNVPASATPQAVKMVSLFFALRFFVQERGFQLHRAAREYAVANLQRLLGEQSFFLFLGRQLSVFGNVAATDESRPVEAVSQIDAAHGK